MMLRLQSRRKVIQLLASVIGSSLSTAAIGAVPKSNNKNSHSSKSLLPARAESFEETLWGETIRDPYRWMENSKDPDYESFLKAQNAHFQSILKNINGYSKLLTRISTLSGSIERVGKVERRGKKIIYDKRSLGSQQYKLYSKELSGGQEDLLFSPSSLTTSGKTPNIEYWTTAPNGLYIIVGTSISDSEEITLNIIDSSTKRRLAESIKRVVNITPQWLPDSSGFFYTKLSDIADKNDANYLLNSMCKLHRLGSNPADDIVVLKSGLYESLPGSPEEFPDVIISSDSEYLVATFRGGVRPYNSFYLASIDEVITGKPIWQKICDLEDEVSGVCLLGEYLYLHTTNNAPNGKVLKAELSQPHVADATIAVAESNSIIENISSAKDGLYILNTLGGYDSLRVLRANGLIEDIELPFEGSIEIFSSNNNEVGLWFGGESWLTPPSVYQVGLVPIAKKVGLTKNLPLNLSSYQVTRAYATARDGTKIPMSIVAAKDIRRHGLNPTLVEAYGAYQMSSKPSCFNGRILAFLEQGGVYVTAHVRGGGEFGKKWWQGGFKKTKPNTWRDLIDCCHTLCKKGWTDPKHLVITGTSAGGIAVGMAMVEEPKLFAAVISAVGVSNPLRSEFSPTGPANIDEFGTVSDYEGFMALRQMDPYQSIRDSVAYPAVLLTTGMNDSRVPPWQVMKMTARLQQASSSQKPILLDVDFDGGHGLTMTRSQADRKFAVEFTFALWQTGHPDFQQCSLIDT